MLIVPIQMRFGWRASFLVFGIFGISWAAGWWRWYRNRPEEQGGITELELTEIGPPPGTAPQSFPWKAIRLNKSVSAIMGAGFAYIYSYYFFLFWLPTYMMRARGWQFMGVMGNIPTVYSHLSTCV